jgi:uncharacterized protein YndB with AHSA1/START domain
MTRVIEFLISILLVVGLFLVIGLFLPSTRQFNHSVETNRPIGTVYDMFNSFGRAKEWLPTQQMDGRLETKLSGPNAGAGAKLDFSSIDSLVGSGQWEIVESVPNQKVRYKLTNKDRGSNKEVTVSFERTGQRKQNVKITSEYKVDYGFDLFGRFAGLYVSRNVGDAMKGGLNQVANFLTTVPRTDYNRDGMKFNLVDLPVEHQLFISAVAPRENTAIATAINNRVQTLQGVLTANNLEKVGPLRIVTDQMTNESYGFDVVMVVRPVGSTEPPTAAANFKLAADVQYAFEPASRAVMNEYTGPAPALPAVRDSIKAWALVHGYDTSKRAFDEYLGPPEKATEETAQFKSYWPIK